MNIYADNSVINRYFDKWNRLYFRGVLKRIPIVWYTKSYKTDSIAKFCYDKETKEPVHFEFNGVRRMKEEDLEDTVIHEMIHYYIRCYLKDVTSESHGEKFLEIMNRINRLFLRHVSISKSFAR